MSSGGAVFARRAFKLQSTVENSLSCFTLEMGDPWWMGDCCIVIMGEFAIGINGECCRLGGGDWAQLSGELATGE